MREFITIEEDTITTRTKLDGNTIIAVRSTAEIWNDSVKGELIGVLKDTGSNVKIQLGDKKFKLDYSEFCNLFDLMLLKTITDKNLRDTNTEIIEI